jgi:hypothetical protein
VVDPTPHTGGQTTPHVDGELAPRLPHERDESADSQPAAPDAVTHQAHEDLKRGLVDTDRGPVLERVYQHQVRPGAPKPAAPAPGTGSGKPR